MIELAALCVLVAFAAAAMWPPRHPSPPSSDDHKPRAPGHPPQSPYRSKTPEGAGLDAHVTQSELEDALEEATRGRTDLLIGIAERLLTLDESPAMTGHAVSLMVYAHQSAGDEEAALRVLGRAPEGAPLQPALVTATLCAARRYHRAARVVEDALIEERIDTLEAESLLERIDRGRERWESAVDALGKAPKRAGDHVVFPLVYEAGRRHGRLVDAAQYGEALHALSPDPDLALSIAQCWSEARDYDKTASWVQRAEDEGRILGDGERTRSPLAWFFGREAPVSSPLSAR